MKSRRFWALLFAVVLVLAACGGDNSADPPGSDPNQSSEDNSTDNGGTDEGENNDGGDGDSGAPTASGDLPASVPDDFPIAIPAGWEVDINGEIGLTVSSPRLLYPADAYDDIVAFYEEWTDAQAEDYSRTEAPQGVIFTRTVTPPYIIQIRRDHEERDTTWTQLIASGSADDG